MNSEKHEMAYEAYREHNSGSRVDSVLTLLEHLREIYPDHHVTHAEYQGWDFEGFANDGLATLSRDPDETYNAQRCYRKDPGPRVGRGAGRLKDRVKFGRWNYAWKGHEYVFYLAEFEESNGRVIPVIFILVAREDEESNADETSLTDQLMLAVGEWSSALQNDIYVFDENHWQKSRDLWKSVEGSSFDDVILDPDVKAGLVGDITGFYDNKDLYKKLSVPWKRGLILHGLPGNGKTITIKSIIALLATREDPIPSLYVKNFNPSQGGTASIRQIFMHARTMAPCLLIFEDIDSLITDATRSYFLNEVDGLESNDGILMIGSTNHLDSLDPAITKRPSRFDRKYHFRLPDEEERRAYCEYWREKLRDNDMVDFPESLCAILALMTEGFSFAYLKELFVTALLTIARGGTGEEESEKLVVVTRSEAVAPEVTEKKGDGEGEVEKEDVPKKHVIPEVETPEQLKSNVFLKVIKTTLKTLVDEMDNTDEADWASSRKQAGGVPSGQGAISAIRLRHIYR